ncbi:MAG: hypothetical protein GYA14_03180, partial [Ignavibacteria bacterium]|nr:hypothetical protein [Ignavibacteria bacterium]
RIEFSLNKNWYGFATIKFSDKTPLLIEAEDIIYITFKDFVIYKGFVDTDYNAYEKEIKVYPFLKRLQEWHYSGSFTNTYIFNILKTIINNMQDKTQIKWNDVFIDITTDDIPISITFENEKIYDIVDKLVKMLNDKYWYVDHANYLHIKKIKRNRVDKYFILNTYNKMFKDVKVRFDYSDIEATYYKVYHKNSITGDIEYIGSVGNSGNIVYPPLPILDKIREREGIYTASESIINPNTALSIAYADLKSKVKAKQSVVVEDVNLDYYMPKIDDYVCIEYLYSTYYDDNNYLFIQNAIFSGVDVVDYGNYFCFIAKETDIYIELDAYDYRWFEDSFNTLYIKSFSDGFVGQIIFFDDEEIDINLNKDEEFLKRFNKKIKRVVIMGNGEVGEDFCYISLKIFADLQKFKYIIDNITQIKYKLNEKGLSCSFTTGDLIEEEGDELFKLRRKVEILENINRI